MIYRSSLVTMSKVDIHLWISPYIKYTRTEQEKWPRTGRIHTGRSRIINFFFVTFFLTLLSCGFTYNSFNSLKREGQLIIRTNMTVSVKMKIQVACPRWRRLSSNWSLYSHAWVALVCSGTYFTKHPSVVETSACLESLLCFQSDHYQL